VAGWLRRNIQCFISVASGKNCHGITKRGGDGVVPIVEADCSRELDPELDELEESWASSRGELLSEGASGEFGASRRLLTLGDGPSMVLALEAAPGKGGPRKKDATV